MCVVTNVTIKGDDLDEIQHKDEYISQVGFLYSIIIYPEL